VDGAGGAFVDTAALMKCLDLVVCVDTAAGHLAGALGVPVWLVLSAVADGPGCARGRCTRASGRGRCLREPRGDAQQWLL
jgi:hypothetical protein